MNAAAIAAFQQQLGELKKITNDTQKAVQVRELYRNADTGLRNVVCTDVLDALASILLYNTNADTGLLPFYYNLCSDSSLNRKNRAKVNFRLASYNAHIAHEADTAAQYLETATTHPEILNDSLRATQYGIAAQINQLRGQLKEAAENLYQSAVYSEKVNDNAGVARTNVNLANVYREMGDYAKSTALRQKALSYFTSIPDDAAMAITTQGLASDFLQLEQFDSAKKYFTACEALFDRGVNNPGTEYYLYLSKAGMYVTLKDYDSSVYYFDKAREILPLFHDPVQEKLFIRASAIAYSHDRNVKEEAKLIQDYIPEMVEAGDLQGARDAYFSLYNISLVQHIGRTPVEYYQLYDSFKTVLSDSRNRDYVAEMESKYESQKKTLKIAVQQKEIQQKNTLNLVLVLSLIAAALFAGVFMVRLQLVRSRKEAKMQRQFTRLLLKNTEEERGRIAAELHDGISHELLTLKNNLQQDTAVTESRIDTIINDIRMISRNLHPVMLDKIGLNHSIQHLCEQLMANGQLFISAEIDYHKQLTKESELQLYRIIQESLTNIVKYADAVAAKITILSKGDKLSVSIVDNGKGFDVAEKLNTQSAFGLHNILERGRALGGKATIHSSGQGTVVHLEIPVSHV